MRNIFFCIYKTNIAKNLMIAMNKKRIIDTIIPGLLMLQKLNKLNIARNKVLGQIVTEDYLHFWDQLMIINCYCNPWSRRKAVVLNCINIKKNSNIRM